MRRSLHLKTGPGVSQPPLVNRHRPNVAGKSRAFSVGAPTTEEVFGQNSLRSYVSQLEREYSESLERLSLCQASLETEGKEGSRALQKRVSELAPVVTELLQLRNKEQELQDIQTLLKDDDADLKRLAESEESACQATIQALKAKILSLLIPSQEVNNNDLILEITAGVGGQESMLFTAEMFEMYQSYAAFKDWHFEVLEYCHSELGGLRHAAASVSGQGSYRHMKYEGGVHRVQRVPRTEKQGRTHTSTMTVAVLPQPTEVW